MLLASLVYVFAQDSYKDRLGAADAGYLWKVDHAVKSLVPGHNCAAQKVHDRSDQANTVEQFGREVGIYGVVQKAAEGLRIVGKGCWAQHEVLVHSCGRREVKIELGVCSSRVAIAVLECS